MSYDHWKTTEPPDPQDAVADDDRFQCPRCDGWMVDGDPGNVRAPNKELICANCAQQDPVIVGELAAQLKADEIRDAFNRTRR